jgi:hypothetical protein
MVVGPPAATNVHVVIVVAVIASVCVPPPQHTTTCTTTRRAPAATTTAVATISASSSFSPTAKCLSLGLGLVRLACDGHGVKKPVAERERPEPYLTMTTGVTAMAMAWR